MKSEVTAGVDSVYRTTHVISQAVDIVNDSGSAPAAYHLARHLEALGRTAEAVAFYTRSSRFNHAIRLAKDHGMDSEVINVQHSTYKSAWSSS